MLGLGTGLAAGLAIAAADNFASGGDVSPIVIVAMLLAVTAAGGMLARRLATHDSNKHA